MEDNRRELLEKERWRRSSGGGYSVRGQRGWKERGECGGRQQEETEIKKRDEGG